MTAHYHSEVIKSWADGLPIQFRGRDGTWHDYLIGCTPAFDPGVEYRVTPQPQIFTQVYHVYLQEGAYLPTFTTAYPSNLRLTFEAGRLIDARAVDCE